MSEQMDKIEETAKVQRKLYAHLRHLRQKYQTIRGRHHDE
jgi:hypothetical protein